MACWWLVWLPPCCCQTCNSLPPLAAGHFVDSLKEMGLAQDMIDEAAGVLIGVRPLFDPERYKGKIDVEKIEKSASGPQTAKSAEGQETPPCCSMM